MSATSRAAETGPSQRTGLRRLLLGLAAWLVAVVVVSSLAGPWLVAGFDALWPGLYPVQRIFRRVSLFFVLVFLVVWARRLGVRRPADLGLTREGWRSGTAWSGLALGGAVVAALLAIEGALGYRRLEVALTPLDAAEMLGGALVIGLFEEAVCRGLLLFPFGRLRGAAFAGAAAAVSALYATAHFARGGRRLETTLDWSVGWEIWASVPRVALAHWQAWLGLFALGLVLYRVAALDGHVWRVAGLHAGAVLALQWGAGLSEPAPGGPLFFTAGLLPGLPFAALCVFALVGLAWRGDLTRSSRAPFRPSTAR
jgi:hypothetical protein